MQRASLRLDTTVFAEVRQQQKIVKTVK